MGKELILENGYTLKIIVKPYTKYISMEKLVVSIILVQIRI